jgi:tetratricopeptide (TPR) repeat protein
MCPRRVNLGVCFASLLISLLSCQLVLPQKKGARVDALAGIEKSVQQGRISEVERPLLTYALANPNNTKALELMARVRVLQGRLEEARSLYQRLLAVDPTSVSAKIGAAHVANSLGQKDYAITLLTTIEAASSLPTSVRLELATEFYSVGEFSRALTVIEGLPAGVRNGEALPLSAAAYLNAGRTQDLINLIPLMKNQASAKPAMAVPNAEVLQNAGLTKDAIALLGIALKRAPTNAKLLLALARLEIFTRKFVEARANLKKAESFDPRSAEIFSAQAMLENALGNNVAALGRMAKARKIDPDSSRILADFAVLAIRAGRPGVAAEAAKILLGREPQNAEYEYLLGAASLQSGNLDSAQSSLESFMQKRPTDSRGCLALGLVLAARIDQIENARRQLTRCIDMDPTNVEARYQLGLSYKAQGENDKAIGYLEDTLKQAPGYAPAVRDLGSLYLQTGAAARARELLERAVSLNPQDGDTHFQLSRLYNQTGEPDLAKRHLEMFQRLRDKGGKPAQ